MVIALNFIHQITKFNFYRHFGFSKIMFYGVSNFSDFSLKSIASGVISIGDGIKWVLKIFMYPGSNPD
jgi:hypothetical protein